MGGGNAWKKDQEDIYRHALGLGIADVPHPWGADKVEGTADDLTKSEWTNFTDRLNRVKAEATKGGTQDFVLGASDEQKQRSSDWYNTPAGAAYAESLGKPVGFGIRGGGGSGGSGGGNTGGLLDAAWADNLNFPMLLSEYNAPNYAPMTNPWGGATIGASYMPWTVEGMANVPEQARSYIAPELTLEHPRYITNPLGLLQLPPDWEDLIDVEDEEEEEEEEGTKGNQGQDVTVDLKSSQSQSSKKNTVFPSEI